MAWQSTIVLPLFLQNRWHARILSACPGFYLPWFVAGATGSSGLPF